MIDITKDLTKCKTPELEAELALYRTFPDVSVPAEDAEEVSTNAKRVAVIEALRAEHGYPYTVSAEDAEKDPFKAEEVAEGETVLLSKEEIEGLTAPATRNSGDPCTLDDGTTGIVSLDGVCVPVATEEQEPKAGDKCENEKGVEGVLVQQGKKLVCVVEPDATAPKKTLDTSKPMYFEGKAVVSISNRIIGGRLYYDVSTGEATYTLTAEEVAVQVTQG